MAAPPIPAVNFAFPNNNLGQTPPSPGNIIAIIGPCTGPLIGANEPRTLGGSPQNVVDQAGYGPAADLAANLVQGGATVVVVPCAYAAAGPSAVTHTGSGLSVMTVTGDPFDRYMQVIVTVVRSATVGAATPPRITISLDAGLSATGAINVPADGVYHGIEVITGMTLNFSVNTMNLGDTYVYYVPYPTVSAADVVTAAIALRQSTEAYSMIYVAAPFNRADQETIISAIGTFEAKKRFVTLFTETLDANGGSEATWMSTLSQDFEGLATDITCVAAGYEPVQSVVLHSKMWRSIGWGAAVRASLVAISRDLGARADGPLVSYAGSVPISKPVFALPYGLFIHDEGLVPGLNTDQFMTIMSEVGLPGYYVTNPNLMSGPVSDYKLLQFRRISDEIARLTNIYFTQQLSSDVLLNASGLILDKEATKWQQANDTALGALVTNQNVSTLATTVGRDANIINDEPIPVTVRWQPKGYPKIFAVTVAMSRTAA